MDEQRTFLVSNLKEIPDEIEIYEMDEESKKKIMKYVSLSEAVQNTHQLLQIFSFNLSQMHSYCELYYNDEIVRKNSQQSLSLIEANGFIINTISAGKTLVEAIERTLQTEMGPEFAEEFKKDYISKPYDEVFSYRFLCYLRNFSQHGYLPVSQKTDSIY